MFDIYLYMVSTLGYYNDNHSNHNNHNYKYHIHNTNNHLNHMNNNNYNFATNQPTKNHNVISGILEFVPLTGHLYCLPVACHTIDVSTRYVTASKHPSYYVLRFMATFPFLYNLLFAALKRRGILSFMWVVNREDEFNMVYRYGASGIFTDRPTRALEFYENNWIKTC